MLRVFLSLFRKGSCIIVKRRDYLNTFQSETKKMIIAALFLALGLIIPYFTTHMFGLPGVIFLPMHIPVLMAGLLLGPKYGAIVGFLTPLLSSILTGMPPMYPVLPGMLVELTVYGFVSGWIRHNQGWGLYPALVIAMLFGRIASGLIFAPLFFGQTFGAQFQILIGNIVTGLPGIIIQLLFVPALVYFVEKALSNRRIYD